MEDAAYVAQGPEREKTPLSSDIEDAAYVADGSEPEKTPRSSNTVTRPTTADNPKISASTEDSKKSFNFYALARKLGIKKEYLRT